MSHQHAVLTLMLCQSQLFLNSFFCNYCRTIILLMLPSQHRWQSNESEKYELGSVETCAFLKNLSLSLYLLSFVHGRTARAVAQWPKAEQRMRLG